MSNGRLRALGSAQHLKTKFGQGYQVELKCKLVTMTDPDFIETNTKLGGDRLGANAGEGEEGTASEEIFFNLEETVAALQELTGDTYLSSVINDGNPIGYNIHKSATSPTGVTLEELSAFATVELRVRKIADYIVTNYTTNIFRERQDTKVRYEVGSEGLQISEIFASLEENKERLLLDDYGVSQTSLEQVFNMHAAAAEHLKGGMDDH
jgi:ATP-binding cassette subfamily A (ABC1) protein 3